MNNRLVSKQLTAFYIKRKSILLTLFSLLLLVAGFLLFLRGPLNSYMENIELSEELNLRLIRAEETLSASRAHENQIIELNQSEKNLISLALPEKPDYPSLITHLTSLSRKSGFFVSGMDIDDLGIQSTKESNNKSVGKLLVKMKLVGGGYNELKSMVGLLQESIMMNDIYSLNFSNKSPIYELNLIVYYDGSNLSKK